MSHYIYVQKYIHIRVCVCVCVCMAQNTVYKHKLLFNVSHSIPKAILRRRHHYPHFSINETSINRPSLWVTHT